MTGNGRPHRPQGDPPHLPGRQARSRDDSARERHVRERRRGRRGAETVLRLPFVPSRGKTRSASAQWRPWQWPACRRARGDGRVTSCGPSGSSCRWRGPWSAIRSSCSWTSPRPGWGSEIEKVEEIIRAIRGSGITVVVVSHDVKMLMNLSDLVTVLNFGEKIAEGLPGRSAEGSPRPGGIPWRAVTPCSPSPGSRCPTVTSTR